MGGPVDWSKQGTQGGYGEQPSYGQAPAPSYGQAPQGGGGYGPPPIPPTNAGWAVAATLFFWPLAFTAFTASSNVVRLWAMGDLAGAQAASAQAKRMGKIAMGILIGIVVLYVVVIVVLISLAASAANSYS
ncbi:CD225/dispanin family protein [Rhodococcus antarcticus]|uniref:CD225/dispanin family protein n=1 Tax=Rhodococcus antarcticus TaxID=2987751 RepID=A0ABY6NXA4_9NOCA|nr:CD225/dispanin family protein [Rhodococcus antarcticus]UZJ24027.1 CD225/dispanin family protein [Rhodococcus antarcticus]